MHFYYPVDPMRVQRNWVCADAAIDFRGAGGSIILPSSWGWCGHDLDLPYTLIATRDDGKPINAVGLHNFLDPVMERRRLAAILRRRTQPSPSLTAWPPGWPRGWRANVTAACFGLPAGWSKPATQST